MLNEFIEYDEYTKYDVEINAKTKEESYTFPNRLIDKHFIDEGKGFGGVPRALIIIARKLLFSDFEYESKSQQERVEIRKIVKEKLNNYLGFPVKDEKIAKEFSWLREYCERTKFEQPNNSKEPSEERSIFDEWVKWYVKSHIKKSKSLTDNMVFSNPKNPTKAETKKALKLLKKETLAVIKKKYGEDHKVDLSNDWLYLSYDKKKEWNKPIRTLTHEKINTVNIESIIADALAAGRLCEKYLVIKKNYLEKLYIEKVSKNNKITYASLGSQSEETKDKFLKWMSAMLLSRRNDNETGARVIKLDVANWMGSRTFANSSGKGKLKLLIDNGSNKSTLIWDNIEENASFSKTYIDSGFLREYDVKLIMGKDDKDFDEAEFNKYMAPNSGYLVFKDEGSGIDKKLVCISEK